LKVALYPQRLEKETSAEKAGYVLIGDLTPTPHGTYLDAMIVRINHVDYPEHAGPDPIDILKKLFAVLRMGIIRKQTDNSVNPIIFTALKRIQFTLDAPAFEADFKCGISACAHILPV
jgi:hypothetical protein